MDSQKRICEPCDLLDENGHLIHPGYATSPLWRYDRKKIKASRFRIKEWDYYYVLSPGAGYGITFTIADLGYIRMAAVCFLDFKSQTYCQTDTLSLFPLGGLNLPPDSREGASCFENNKIKLDIHVHQDNRRIFFETKGCKGLKGQIDLTAQPRSESMVIATSWRENPRAFYYNQKINCMAARGEVTMGGKTYGFTPDDAFGGLDWGRGNWTYQNRWYWGSASGLLKGVPFGWNLGYGFSDRSPASENMVFYDGKAHKLADVTFHMDIQDYMKPWKISSSDGRFEMDFFPLLDRESDFDLRLIKSIQHQVFGYFSGRVMLDDGQVFEVDRFFGFAEDVLNWW